ncbi:MAG: metalloregulator ArsR/SmtB family transcription factor [Bacteroidales bacterium]|jgi:ArsR family transcriptional regulator|nr:metalloregulator ArsR/SmtB family transcription factor [Bacteroidales bacterium]NLM92708.1 helix-turn-helix transcriptional regulator [Bacteroidales bacterium]
MIRDKRVLFDEELQKQAALFKVLGHPARLAILQYLAHMKTCMTGNIAEELPLSRTTVNQHLKELRDAGLIKGTVEGARKNYCLDARAIEMLKQAANDFFTKIDIRKTYC